MNYVDVAVLAVIQGLAELLPVSSSAHVIMAEKLLGLDPSSPEMTMLLVMLHTGTMFAVIVYFWKTWRETYFSSLQAFRENALLIIVATGVTGFVGLALMKIIKYFYAHNAADFEIESLFSNSKLIAGGLAAAGLLIIFSSRLQEKPQGRLSVLRAAIIGFVQGLCLPFRGFSRSGATISTGLSLGIARQRIEAFSFALAVALTPAVIIKEALRVGTSGAAGSGLPAVSASAIVLPCIIGMVLSFISGLLALRWLSRWLEHDRWHLFGGYCLCAALLVGLLE